MIILGHIFSACGGLVLGRPGGSSDEEEAPDEDDDEDDDGDLTRLLPGVVDFNTIDSLICLMLGCWLCLNGCVWGGGNGFDCMIGGAGFSIIMQLFVFWTPDFVLTSTFFKNFKNIKFSI